MQVDSSRRGHAPHRSDNVFADVPFLFEQASNFLENFLLCPLPRHWQTSLCAPKQFLVHNWREGVGLRNPELRFDGDPWPSKALRFSMPNVTTHVFRICDHVLNRL